VGPGQKTSMTVSLGLAVWPGDGAEPESLLAATDRALYAAKQGGRDPGVAASSLAPEGTVSGPGKEGAR
jgi:PleD family two-component response regulator